MKKVYLKKTSIILFILSLVTVLIIKCNKDNVGLIGSDAITTCKISGKVTDIVTNASIANAYITSDEGTTAITNSNGEFSLTVTKGNRVISAFSDNYIIYNKIDTINSDETNKEIKLLYSQNAGISGIVKGSINSPEGELSDSAIIYVNGFITRTDKNGYYILRLPVGSYTMVVTTTTGSASVPINVIQNTSVTKNVSTTLNDCYSTFANFDFRNADQPYMGFNPVCIENYSSYYIYIYPALPLKDQCASITNFTLKYEFSNNIVPSKTFTINTNEKNVNYRLYQTPLVRNCKGYTVTFTLTLSDGHSYSKSFTQKPYYCSCDTTNTNQLPTITTNSISNITSNSATCGGNVTNAGGSTITNRGVCWGTSSNPTISNSKTSNGTGIGSFTSSITGLSANTTYYVRAYATNSAGTAYGSQISFTTSNSVNFSLDGKWLSSAGTGIIISGASGTFYSFSSGWQSAADLGFVSIGNTKLKNISKVSTYKWNCLELWTHNTNGVIDYVIWSSDGTITMSSDGQSFSLFSNATAKDGTTYSATSIFYRQP